jgi:oligoendopeptidase F
MYVELLRDTGRMRPDDLIKKHLSQDLNAPQFWQNSFDIAKKSVQEYERLSKSN